MHSFRGGADIVPIPVGAAARAASLPSVQAVMRTGSRQTRSRPLVLAKRMLFRIRDRVCVALLAALCACSTDGSPGSSGQITLPSDTIRLSLTKGPDSASQRFSIGSTAGEIQWTASATVPWLSVRPSSGSTPAQVSVVAKSDGLQPGSYQGFIRVESSDANLSGQMPVTLQVAPAPVIAVTPAVVSFSGVAGGGSVSDQAISIDAGTASTLAWSVTSSASWLTASPGSGTGTGTVILHVNPAELSAGAHSATVTVQAPLAGNTPQTVAVNLTIVPQFTVSVSASPTSLGSVTGGGTYAQGATARVTAIPASGAEFTGWTSGATQTLASTDANYTFIVNDNVALVAGFRSSSVTISTSSEPAAGGTTSGGGQIARGTTVRVFANPASGYRFVDWREGSTPVSTSATYTFTVNQPRTLVADFTKTTATNVTIVASASPSGAGSVTGGGTYPSGAPVTLTATPASGYTFTNWTDNDVVVSNGASYTFVASEDRMVTANFVSPGAQKVTITTTASPSAGGTTTGGGSYSLGTPVTVTATPSAGYTFVNWTENGRAVSQGGLSYSFIASADRSLTANFSPGSSPTYTVSATVSPIGAGTVTGVGTYTSGSVAVLQATPAPGYQFVNWTENGVDMGGSAVATNISLTVTSNRSLVANFIQVGPTHVTITTSSNPTNGGTTSGGGTYEPNAGPVELYATPNPEFVFLNWTENGTVVSTLRGYVFTPTVDRSLVANFTTSPYIFSSGLTVNAQDELVILLNISAPLSPSLVSVQAAVNGRSTTLTVGRAYFEYDGKLSLAGLPDGALTLVVTMTNAEGRVTTANVPFVHNPPPPAAP